MIEPEFGIDVFHVEHPQSARDTHLEGGHRKKSRRQNANIHLSTTTRTPRAHREVREQHPLTSLYPRQQDASSGAGAPRAPTRSPEKRRSISGTNMFHVEHFWSRDQTPSRRDKKCASSERRSENKLLRGSP